MSVHDFKIKDNKGNDIDLGVLLKGKVGLFVNVASKCGFVRRRTRRQRNAPTAARRNSTLREAHKRSC